MEILTLLVLVGIIVLAVIFIPKLLNNDTEKKIKKQKLNCGLNKGNKVLKAFASENGFRYLGACKFVKGEETVEVSSMVIGTFGIFGIIENGRNNEVYGTEKEKQWVQISKDKKEYFENPMDNANRSVVFVREPLSNNKLHNIQIEILPVFCASNLSLVVPKSCKVYKPKQLKGILFKDKYIKDRKVNMDKVYEVLSAYKV